MATYVRLASVADGAARSRQSLARISVVLADDRATVRRSLRLLLEGERDVEVVAEAEEISQVLHHVRGELPQVLVLDLQMPNGSSVDMIRRLRADAPDTEVVVLTMQDSPLFAGEALDAGAVGYVIKERADSDLPAAVRHAARGEEYVSSPMAAALATLRSNANGDGLSPRETEVLRLIALGYTSAEIASRLHLSRRTVETHRARIHRKLGLAARHELVHHALRRHLIGG